ncbi:MAG: hypothetical protein L6V81_08005 [Clostridium sp.]|nr:MAG: hypothetical protein L6V81_08005 [Clostridium sp.]
MYLKRDGTKRVLLDKTKINKYIEEKTLQGERVLALAINNDDEFKNLTLLGFIFLKR